MNSYFSAPKLVLVLFALTACIGFLTRILSNELFAGALMSVLSFYYGSKQGEAAANLVNAQMATMNANSTVPTPVPPPDPLG